jgi:hypothetical protein
MRGPAGPESGRWRAGVWLVALLLLAGGPAHAGDRVDPGTLTGKMIMGYQGWFACPGDGAPLGWGHWGQTRQGQFVAAVDMLPDVTELAPAQRCETVMRTAGGQTVDLFSDQRLATVELQFAWMQQYGLDGVAVQRFASVLGKPPVLKAFDTVLANVRHAAQDHGRVFFVMYDLSGMAGRDLPAVAQDWDRLLHEGLAASPAYLHHRGHALLGLWGLGFAGRPVTPGDAGALVDALAKASAAYGGVTLLGGVPSYWRTRAHDAAPDPGWDGVWRRLGVISPWSVGRFADDAGADGYRRAVLEPDNAAARALGADYMPVVFPGFSWANLQRDQQAPAKAIRNVIPRRCGRFYWRQVSNALASGATMLYGAMFDEVNEGTAMFKTLASAGQAPAQGMPPGYAFVTLDSDGCSLPSDWYLRLAGAATTALRGGARPPADLPLALPRN